MGPVRGPLRLRPRACVAAGARARLARHWTWKISLLAGPARRAAEVLARSLRRP